MSHSAVVDSWRERERALRRRGHDVTVVSAARWQEGGREVPLVPRPGEAVVAAPTLGHHPALFVYDPRPLWAALGEPLDVIDVHEEPFALATAEVLLLRWLRRQRAPYVLYTAQNLDKRYPVPFRWVERAALRGARGVSACNAAAARIAERKGFPGRARTIDLGTDLSVFTPAGAADRRAGGAAERSGQADAPLVGYAGRLDPAKGVDVLVRAAALEATVRVRVAGDGPERESLEALADQLGIADRVEFVGPLAAEALPDFYRSLDALAVPSLTTASWVEQFGRVALEAMACGTPVVVSDSGALPGAVDGAALVVPEGDPAALAKALQQVTSDAVVRSRLVADGLRRAQASSWDEVATAYERLYRLAAHDRITETTGGSASIAERPLDVVVVAYGQPALLARALAPLDGLSVTVVDNSSSPEVRAVVERTRARYVDPGRNGGFAAGVNEGLRRADPRADVLLVNPDAVIDRPAIETLRAALAADGTLATVGPAQFDATGRPSRVAWPFPTPLGTWVDAAGLGRLRRSSYVIGSVLLLRQEALEQVGPFDDERFFLYSEETDWAYRATRLGWRHRVVDEVNVEHEGAATSTDESRREGHFLAAHEIYLRKHYGALGWQVSRAGNVAGSVVRAALLRGDGRRAARERALLYLRGPARHESRPADARTVPAPTEAS
ncbi:glycosyltransferase [Humibacillus xanthopallidus]|uniref:glycosyltransferase n=1 Tax=Humibacillus xanthopallidus TaxID=412689 RepID=UPI0021AB568D|nr:glycosyltransferase [Humibacillus xanthopallidus]